MLEKLLKILAKKSSERTKEENDFVSKHSKLLTAEQRKELDVPDSDEGDDDDDDSNDDADTEQVDVNVIL